jgi:hypothetical protein
LLREKILQRLALRQGLQMLRMGLQPLAGEAQ